MSFLNRIRDKALEEIEDLSETELQNKVAEGLEEARDLLPSEEDKSDAAKITRRLGNVAIDKLKTHEKEIGKLGMYGVVSLVSSIASGKEQDALLIFLREEASWEDITKSVKKAQAKTVQNKIDYDAAKETAWGIIKSIGSTTARAALPFLLGVL